MTTIGEGDNPKFTFSQIRWNMSKLTEMNREVSWSFSGKLPQYPSLDDPHLDERMLAPTKSWNSLQWRHLWPFAASSAGPVRGSMQLLTNFWWRILALEKTTGNSRKIVMHLHCLIPPKRQFNDHRKCDCSKAKTSQLGWRVVVWSFGGSKGLSARS